MNQQKPLLLESALGWLSKKASEYKIPLFSSLLFGMMAYGFNLTNKLINHDEAASLFTKGGTMVLGRWGLDILERIFPNVSVPWLYGLVTLVLMAVAVCVILSIFHIRRPLTQVLLAGAIMVFPSLTSTMAYMFTCAPYAVAFLLAVWAVWLMKSPSWQGFLLALGLMIFSLSIYQSYIAVAAGLLVLMLIQALLEGADVAAVVRKGFLCLLFLILSLGLYYAATRVLMKLTNVGFSGYASGNMTFSLAELPGKAVIAYESFFRFFGERLHGLIPTAVSQWMHHLLLAAMAGMFLLWGIARREREWQRLLLLAALVGILPLAINCMYLFTAEEGVHTLVLYGFICMYVLAVILAELDLSVLGRRAVLEGLTVALAVIVAVNLYVANTVSLNLYLRYENAFSFYTALAADIKQMPEFDENTKLAVTGQYKSPDFFYEHFADENKLTGTAGFFPDNYSKNFFMEYYLGFPIPVASEEDIQAVTATEEYSAMPCYPYYGSMKFFEDILVVKLS